MDSEKVETLAKGAESAKPGGLFWLVRQAVETLVEIARDVLELRGIVDEIRGRKSSGKN